MHGPAQPRCLPKLDLCLVLDSSRQIRQQNPSNGFYDNWGLSLDISKFLVDTQNIGPDATRVAAMVFSDTTRQVFSLTQYSTVTEIREALSGIPYMGQDANIAQAMGQIGTLCFNGQDDREDGRKVVVMVTAGIQTNPGVQDEQVLAAATELREAGVTIIPVGITDVVNLDLLRSLSAPPNREGEDFYTAADFTVLTSLGRKLGECHDDGELNLILIFFYPLKTTSTGLMGLKLEIPLITTC